MRDDSLDRALFAEKEILPSSGFAASVMDAVRQEAAAPPPIPFPWKRALPGLVAAGMVPLLLVYEILALARGGATTEPASAGWTAVIAPSLGAATRFGAHWIALALLVTLASVKLTMLLAAERA